MSTQPLDLRTTMRTDTYFYRYEDVLYAAPLDDFDRPMGSARLEVVRRRYRVVKVTPCGVWLDIGRFVKTSGRKRFAWPTEAEALVSFQARKQRQLSILRAQASRVERAVERAHGIGGPVQAQPEPAQEPVAKVRWNDIGHISWRAQVMLPDNTPLYTAPQPQRKPLTEEEISDIYIDWDITPGRRIADLVRAIERKVRGE